MVTDIAKTTVEYTSQTDGGDFNNIILTDHPTQYGVQFITWEKCRKEAACTKRITTVPAQVRIVTLPPSGTLPPDLA